MLARTVTTDGPDRTRARARAVGGVPSIEPATGVPITRGQLLGITLGNALEFYDFLVFSFFAVQIGQCFFPAADPHSSLLLALATFGAGFLTRPIGAWVIGGLADRIGRRPMLLLSFTMIGASTLGVAITPSYAMIGLAAPITVILCRLVQGFALAAVMSDDALASRGWRIAMAIGAATVPVGLMLRRSLPETLHRAAAETVPPRVGGYAGIALFAFATILAATITNYVLNYMTTFAKTTLGMATGVSLGATVAIGLGNLIGSLTGGVMADRHGRRPWMIWPMAISTAAIMPGYWLLTTYPVASTLYAVSFLLRLALAIAATTALIAVVEALPARARSGALAIVYALAVSIFGGSTQFVVAWLTQATGDPLAPAWYMLAAAVMGLVAMTFARETAPLKGRGSAPPEARFVPTGAGA